MLSNIKRTLQGLLDIPKIDYLLENESWFSATKKTLVHIEELIDSWRGKTSVRTEYADSNGCGCGSMNICYKGAWYSVLVYTKRADELLSTTFWKETYVTVRDHTLYIYELDKNGRKLENGRNLVITPVYVNKSDYENCETNVYMYRRVAGTFKIETNLEGGSEEVEVANFLEHIVKVLENPDNPNITDKSEKLKKSLELAENVDKLLSKKGIN